MNWWSSNQLRLIQNNLREIDAGMNVDLLMKELQEFHANVLMMNAGESLPFILPHWSINTSHLIFIRMCYRKPSPRLMS
ncbi:hypothetical protein P9222_32490 [Paenibacillus amylolyticus]|nr:hypothetical protein [Paenibacillus amylolyticus]WFR62775.1 hypothetical protein P9222_32490 [Paenibacillus amylolyticus]